MRIKYKRKINTAKKLQKGTVGNFFVYGMLGLLVVLGITAIGGVQSPSYDNSGTPVNIVTPTLSPNHSTLQLQWFGYVTSAPTPTFAPPAAPSLCQEGGANDEATILVAYSPISGQTVSQTGQIKVWVADEGAPIIAPGEILNSSGQITTPGNQSAKAPDNYLWEPALYIAPQTAESGGTPHFPSAIKGDYNNDPNNPRTAGSNIVGMDPIPAGTSIPDPSYNQYRAEDIWDVSTLGLGPGNYTAEFVIHDGDENRGVGCVSIQIQ
jgi:hypothetical protein